MHVKRDHITLWQPAGDGDELVAVDTSRLPPLLEKALHHGVLGFEALMRQFACCRGLPKNGAVGNGFEALMGLIARCHGLPKNDTVLLGNEAVEELLQRLLELVFLHKE